MYTLYGLAINTNVHDHEEQPLITRLRLSPQRVDLDVLNDGSMIVCPPRYSSVDPTAQALNSINEVRAASVLAHHEAS